MDFIKKMGGMLQSAFPVSCAAAIPAALTLGWLSQAFPVLWGALILFALAAVIVASGSLKDIWAACTMLSTGFFIGFGAYCIAYRYTNLPDWNLASITYWGLTVRGLLPLWHHMRAAKTNKLAQQTTDTDTSIASPVGRRPLIPSFSLHWHPRPSH